MDEKTLNPMELDDEELEKAAGGVSGLSGSQVVIRVQYSYRMTRRDVRDELIRTMAEQDIPTDRVPDAAMLWANGMETGARGGTMVYVCDEDGRMIDCYKG